MAESFVYFQHRLYLLSHSYCTFSRLISMFIVFTFVYVCRVNSLNTLTDVFPSLGTGDGVEAHQQTQVGGKSIATPSIIFRLYIVTPCIVTKLQPTVSLRLCHFPKDRLTVSFQLLFEDHINPFLLSFLRLVTFLCAVHMT